MTIADQLISISNTKSAIKTAIEAKGVTVGSVAFDEYPNKISQITTGSGGDTPAPWVRPSDWLAMPSVSSSEQKFVGLFAIFDNQSNTATFRFTGATYTVDWGDGNVQNFNSGVQATHVYNYADVSVGSISSRGYKQVIVTVTSAGTITGLDLSLSATSNAGGSYKSQNWLDIVMSMPSLGNSFVMGSTTTHFPLCERVNIKSVSPSGTTASSLFQNFFSLQEITSAFKFSSGGSGFNTFRNCRSLRALPNFDFSALTGNGYTYSNMFSACSSLVSIPDTFPPAGAVTTPTSFANMFDSCDSLKEIPPSLGNVPCSSLSYAFAGCRSIKTIPPLNTSSATTVTYAFKGCNNLTSVNISFGNATSASYCFADCISLSDVTITSSGSVTDFSNCFSNCFNLERINDFSCASAINVTSIFNTCYSLVATPSLNWSTVTSITTPFNGCYNLSKINIVFPAVTFSIGNCRLSSTELNAVYTALPTATSKTITVGGNWGIAGDDPTIASSKGWTVTGS